MTGSVSGTVFDDVDGNAIQDPGEVGIENRLVYLDANQNSVWDTGESTATTNANGEYQFSGLGDGEYWIGLAVNADERQTTPGPVAGPATLGDVRAETPITFDVFGAHGITFHHGSIFATAVMEDRVYELDPGSGNILSRLAIPGGSSLLGIASDNSHLWAIDIANDVVMKLDFTGQVVDSIPAPGTSPQGITWDGEMLWVSDSESETIDQIDPATGQIIATIEAPGSTGTVGAMASDGKSLWINRVLDPWETSPTVRDANRTYEIDLLTGDTLRSFVTPLCS